MKITLIKGLDNKFSIAYNSDYEVAKKLSAGKEFLFEVKKSRNIRFHRKYFALLNLVFQNQEKYNNIEHLRNDLTIVSGYYTQRLNLQGETVTEHKSISFAKMTELEFSELYSATLDSIVKYFGFDREDMINNIEQFF